jgi:hypothetical protein
MSYCELLAVFMFLFANSAIHAIKLCKANLVLALLLIGPNRIGQCVHGDRFSEQI